MACNTHATFAHQHPVVFPLDSTAAELLRQVAALEASGEGERDRRREVEAALQVGRCPSWAPKHSEALWACVHSTCTCIQPLGATRGVTHDVNGWVPMQEASAIFKRELADKNQQLELLRQEIR